MEEAKEKRIHDIFFDLSFTNTMIEKELNSLIGQIARSLSVMKTSKYPFAVHLCSYTGKIKELMDAKGCCNWIAYLHSEDLQNLTILPKNLYYLSPDADEELETFDETTSFIIGGLVDRTVTSCTSLIKAKSCNIKAVRLPLSKFTIKVL